MCLYQIELLGIQDVTGVSAQVTLRDAHPVKLFGIAEAYVRYVC